jgi:regulatory protein
MVRRPLSAPRDRSTPEPQTLRARALALLARRDYAAAELALRLARAGHPDEGVAELIEELAQDGVLNDERYAHNFVSYHAARGQGPLRIAAELRQRGVSAPLIEAALGAGPDWRALANQVRRGRFGPQSPASWSDKARQSRFLQYRGFSSDDIRAATGADPDME